MVAQQMYLLVVAMQTCSRVAVCPNLAHKVILGLHGVRREVFS